MQAGSKRVHKSALGSKGGTDLTGKYSPFVLVEIWCAEVQWGLGRVASRVQILTKASESKLLTRKYSRTDLKRKYSFPVAIGILCAEVQWVVGKVTNRAQIKAFKLKP